MRPIPDKLRKKLSNMPHMAQCAWCTAKSNLEWHHAIQYSGKQMNEWYAIIALCRQCHRGEFGTLRAEIKDFCELLETFLFYRLFFLQYFLFLCQALYFA